ncbi:MAG: dihydropteroate synthase [Tetrasphaera jenkinsii]|jgi:dihydropteroate synthase|nr:dihydropteroate synthase [Tetrasphaera jenkinsii]
MGVVNVTPDSFSDTGAWFDAEAAIAQGRLLHEQGAHWIDVGGESTRPGALRPDAAEELRRVVPVIEALAGEGIAVSVDTMRAEVAAAALAAGATMVNDVSGGLADPALAGVVADSGVDFVAMHWRGHSADMYARAHYLDVVADVARELRDRVAALTAAGIARERIVLDPGLGFAKTADHNWALLRGLPSLLALGHRVLVGTSRKRFLGLVGRTEETLRPTDQRDVVTAVTSAYAADAGVWAVRVHDVRATVDALDVWAAWPGSRQSSAVPR